MTETITRFNQPIPCADWEEIRARFPGRSAVRLLDPEQGVDEFVLLDPRADLADAALDGHTFEPAAAEETLKEFAVQRLPENQQKPWPLRS